MEKMIKFLNGALTVAKLQNEGEYLLVLVSKAKSFVVPLIKGETSVAYLNGMSDADYEKLSRLIEKMNVEKTFSLCKFTPRDKVAPEHSKVVVDFLKPTGIKRVVPKGIGDVLKANGYELRAKEMSSPFTPRNYDHQLEENEDFLRQFKEEAEELRLAGATYESLPREVKNAYETIEQGGNDGIIFAGPAGTGKTWMTMILACKAKAHRENIQITPDTDVDDLQGHFIPDGQGKAKFIEGPLLQAYYKGYVLSIQECNLGQPGTNSCLNSFLDGTKQVTINGKTYHRHPNFVCYMTMNPGYAGTEPLNMALKNRFSIIQVPALTEAEFTERLKSYSKYLGHEVSKEFCTTLYKDANILQQKAAGAGWHENVAFSFRNAQRLLQNIMLKARSFDDFFSAFSTEYLNHFNCDNDNSEKLTALKKEDDIINMVKALYDKYDFSEVEEVKMLDDLDELFATPEPEATDGADVVDEDSSEMIDSLLKKMGVE